MPPLPTLLSDCIVKTTIKINQSNVKTFCKYCIDVLGEEEGKKIYFPNKKDRIVLHLKKCNNFLSVTTPEKQAEIFASADNLSTKKRLCKLIFY
jgi:hypothetical protein